MDTPKTQTHPDSDEHIGAVEGDRPEDSPQHGNPHGAGSEPLGPSSGTGTGASNILRGERKEEAA